MAYFIEFGLAAGEAFYAEFALINAREQALIDTTGVDHRLNALGWVRDYGCFEPMATTIASNANGLITQPEDGLLCVSIPFDRWQTYGRFPGHRQSLRFQFVAAPLDDTARTQLLAHGTISFGGP